MPHSKADYEYLRYQARERFDKVRSTWLECGRWALPHRIRWMLSQTAGQRNNQHVVDNTHTLALRSYVAGFLEGNTSATRPWFRIGSGDSERDMRPENHLWLDTFTRKTLKLLTGSNFYNAAGAFYYDYGVFNTGVHYIDEMPDGTVFFHTLVPGSYYLLNDGFGIAITLVREMSFTVKALVELYGKRVDGKWDWSNFSSRVRKLYEDGTYTQMIDIVHVVKDNKDFDPHLPIASLNKKWISVTYELGGEGTEYLHDTQSFGDAGVNPVADEDKFLQITASKRKPFIVGKSDMSNNFEYGEKGPTLDALGLIKSLNKKAIGKDQALEQMLRPALQGPASLKKSYVTSAPNSYVPLDALSASQKGLRPVFEINPGIGALIQDVTDLRQQVDKLYYADYLLFLSQNPKTRTATETDAIVNEQQLVIGPNLQSLNWTYNVPVVDFAMDYTLDEDPDLPPPPDDLRGSFLRPEFISVFAQAQRAADLPSIERYVAMVAQVGQLQPQIWDKVNLDKLADLYEDRLYLPAGLNNPQEKTDALREQAQAQLQKQQQIEQATQLAGAAKDVGLQVKQGEQS